MSAILENVYASYLNRRNSMITYISVIENQSAKCEAYLWTGQRWKNPLPAIEIHGKISGNARNPIIDIFQFNRRKNFVIYFV
jgi:hypothetical protein